MIVELLLSIGPIVLLGSYAILYIYLGGAQAERQARKELRRYQLHLLEEELGLEHWDDDEYTVTHETDTDIYIRRHSPTVFHEVTADGAWPSVTFRGRFSEEVVRDVYPADVYLFRNTGYSTMCMWTGKEWLPATENGLSPEAWDSLRKYWGAIYQDGSHA